jgi:glycosyltransferase involved in cell wall biosynthesis
VHHGSIGRQEVFQLLLHSDIGLLSSKSEGQPNSVMEYMYIGLPVVATNIPGIREVVGEENEQWLFEVGDAEGLAGLITRLKENPVLRAELGLRNRRRIIEQFGPERVLPRWAELVERG